MAVTINPPIAIGNAGWKITWTGTGPYYIYADGKLVGTTETEEWILQTLGVIEIIEAAAPERILTGRLVIQWDAIAAIDYYSVEQYFGSYPYGAWTEIAQIKDDGSPLFQYETGQQSDESAQFFRVKAVGENGNVSGVATNAVTRRAVIARHPDVPDVSYSFSNATKKITITAN